MKTCRMVLLATLIGGPVWAGSVPMAITYQGTLKQQGVPVNGPATLTFRLTSSDGTVQYWTAGDLTVNVSQGLFSVVLSPTGVDWQNVIPYIEM